MVLTDFWPESVKKKVLNGGDLNFLLQNNSLLISYLRHSEVTTTNLMLGNPHHQKWEDLSFNPDQTRFSSVRERELHGVFSRVQRDQVRAGSIVSEHTIYAPVTPSYIKYLIEMDEVLRLSKSFNHDKKEIYRGTVHIKDTNLMMLNSWSTSKTVARGFQTGRGCLMQTTLPAGFPYIDVPKAHCNVVYREDEILLPPCEFEVSSTDIHAPLHATLRPLNLAKVFLQRLNNLPDDYPLLYQTSPVYGFAEAKKMLEDYIKNYVDKGIIQVGDIIVQEKPDPVVEFEFDHLEPQE